MNRVFSKVGAISSDQIKQVVHTHLSVNNDNGTRNRRKTGSPVHAKSEFTV